MAIPQPPTIVYTARAVSGQFDAASVVSLDLSAVYVSLYSATAAASS